MLTRPIKMPAFVLGQIDKYCEAIYTGSKPCAVFTIQDRYKDEAIGYIEQYKIWYRLERTLYNWWHIWIFKRGFYGDIIKDLPEKPESTKDHWILGKLFGYSDEAIEGFLERGQPNYCILTQKKREEIMERE